MGAGHWRVDIQIFRPFGRAPRAVGILIVEQETDATRDAAPRSWPGRERAPVRDEH